MAVAVDLVGLAAGLESEHVAWRELTDEERPLCAVDGQTPTAVCWPESYGEAASALAVANRLGLAVSPRGSGSKLGLGNPPRSCDLVVSTERLNQIVEYAPANLTVTAQAGVRLADLQAHLSSSRQFLPMDPPFASVATLGGILATNSSGPRRLGFGIARDLVIGSRVATTSGMVTRAGGRVVKNVAGYDLNKLYIGSLGTLALFVEIGFKVAPRPAAQTTVIGQFERLDQIAAITRSLRRSPLAPIATDLVNAAAVVELGIPGLPDAGQGYLLAVLGAAPGAAVDRQTSSFAQMFQDAGATQIADVVSDFCDEFWAHVAEWPYRDADPHRLRLKLAVPPGRLTEAVRSAELRRGELGNSIAIGARAGSGIVYLTVLLGESLADDDLALIVRGILELRQNCRDLEGSLVVEQCPLQVKERLDVWGDVGSSLPIMRNLKYALDPGGIMNPGRFAGGI